MGANWFVKAQWSMILGTAENIFELLSGFFELILPTLIVPDRAFAIGRVLEVACEASVSHLIRPMMKWLLMPGTLGKSHSINFSPGHGHG
jgi:hypothetical protein